MILNKEGLKNKEEWINAGYNVSTYNRLEALEKTKENPFWIHFGAGNIFRAFQANVVQNLLNDGVLDRGLIVAEGYDYEIIEKINHKHDDYSILVKLKSDGTIEKTIVDSVMESLILDSDNISQFDCLKEIFKKKSLQIASFTITEKGYSLVNGMGNMLPDVLSDMERGPEKAKSYIGKVTSLLYERYLSGEMPIAMVSMDNCSHNGTKLYEAVNSFAKEWSKSGLVEKGFYEYINNKEKVSFPWSMIDKITPRPNESVMEILQKDGVEDLEPIITTKKTYVAPFVNSEECEYLVIEDSFPNGRPKLEEGGLIFTTREIVDKVEKMKVCTCLNPLHTALAIFGCLLGYNLISEEIKDESLKKLVEGIGYKEGLPVVVNPEILNPKKFIDTVLNIRIPNPFMPDTPQRIATDTSQKLAIRFGETIKAYMNSQELDVKDLKLIPLVFAGWIRYLMAIDDEGKAFELSPDPLINSLKPIIKPIHLGEEYDYDKLLEPILSNKNIFGVDLYEIGMASTVCSYFKEMTSGYGAVRKTLEEYV